MDRFQDMANKGLDFLKSRAKETVEAQQFHSALRDLTARRERALQDLGHRVVAMYDLPEFDKEAVRDRVEEIRRLTEEIGKAQAEFDAVTEQLKSSVEEVLPHRPQASAVPQPPSYD